MALSPRWRAVRESSREPPHSTAGFGLHFGACEGQRYSPSGCGGGGQVGQVGGAAAGGGIQSNLAGQTFGEAFASFHTEGTVASQRHSCMLLAPHLHLPERSSSIYDKTVNLRDAEFGSRSSRGASVAVPPSSLAKPTTPRQSSVPFTPQPRTPSSGQGRNVSFSEPLSAPASAYPYAANTACAGATPPALAAPYRRASSLGPVPALPAAALIGGRRDWPSEPTSFLGAQPRSGGEGLGMAPALGAVAAAPAATASAHYSPPPQASASSGRGAAFSRLHDFLLRTHISSLLSALAEDGWLLPRERDVLNTRAREESRSWSSSFNRAYIRFLETDNVQVFVSDLRALLV